MSPVTVSSSLILFTIKFWRFPKATTFTTGP
jgi:hypothetical protein